ncbi:MAG: YkgJ family cysteine cluster protein [Spirochaetes bacterium]|nr:YkgJ family cysteine cluster protein [Spirochaetota bacterium]
MDKIILENIKNLDFSCQRCSNCCRLEPGAVFLTQEDAENISEILNLSLNDFLTKYCREIYKGEIPVVALKEKKNYDCILWNNGCTVYNARPIQCRTYPYWPYIVESKEYIDLEKRRCKGIGIKGDLTLEEKIKLYELEENSKYMIWNK